MASSKFQGGLQVKGKIKLPDELAGKAIIIDGSGDIASSATTSTELSHLSGVTSSVQSQMNAKASSSDLTTHISDTANPHSVTKAQVGLSNVDNTSDASKPVSSAQQSALDLKAPLASPTFTGTVSGISKSMVGLSSVDNTSDVNKPISSATQTALNNKADLVSGKLATSQIPALAITDTFVVVSQVAMLALTAQTGDIAIRSDESKTYILQGADSTILANWIQLQTPASSVLSVNSQTGVVVLAKADIGLANVDNTSDASKDSAATTLTNKTISTATNTISGLSVTNLGAGVLDSDLSSVSASHDTIPSAKAVKAYADSLVGSSAIAGDISLTTFNAADGQVAPANVTGLSFAAGTVRAFKALVSVTIDATADLFEVFELIGIQKGASYDMAINSVGDDSGVVFSINSAGQVQYTSVAKAGFATNKVAFRAQVTNI